MPGWKRFAIIAAERQQAEGVAVPEAGRCWARDAHHRDGADARSIAAEQEIALRITHLAAAGLAALEQGFEGFQCRVVGRSRAQESLRHAGALRGIDAADSSSPN